MTDFDPNATPECDANLRFVNSAGKTYVCLPLETGVELERRARVAEHELEQTRKKLSETEEKLRIAIITLKELADPNSLFDSVLFSQSQLEEIERVGK